MMSSFFRLHSRPCYVLLVAFVWAVMSGKALAGDTRRLIFAHVYETSEPLHIWAIWAANEIKSRTDGRYQIDVFPMSTLGKEAQLNQSLSLGVVDIIYTGTSFAAQTFPPMALSELPYIFSDFEHWQRFRDSEVFMSMAEGYSERSKGNRVLACGYYGQRHLTSNMPIKAPEGMSGLKVRVPNAAVYKLFPSAVDANPSPIAFSEVYLALQQGVVDAQENPLPTIKAKKFYEVNKHINLTGHIIGSTLSVVSDRLWKELSDADRVIFQQVLQEAAQGVTSDVRQSESELIAWFKEQGVSVHDVDRAAFRARALPAHAELKQKMGASFYERLQAL